MVQKKRDRRDGSVSVDYFSFNLRMKRFSPLVHVFVRSSRSPQDDVSMFLNNTRHACRARQEPSWTSSPTLARKLTTIRLLTTLSRANVATTKSSRARPMRSITPREQKRPGLSPPAKPFQMTPHARCGAVAAG